MRIRVRTEAPRHYHQPDAALVRPPVSCAITGGDGLAVGAGQPTTPFQERTESCWHLARSSIGLCIYAQRTAEPRASWMLDIAAGILVLASVGIFLAHTLDAYRAQ
jgi:hypothetical protein